MRVRVLDDEVWRGGLTDAAATATQWSRLPLVPRAPVIVENLETLLALPPMPGIVAVHGSGYGTAARLRGIDWIESARRLVYWGDLDSHGFGILHELRASHDHVETVLMDEETLLAHRDLWVAEPTPARGVFSSLTAAEAASRARLRQKAMCAWSRSESPGRMRGREFSLPWPLGWSDLRELSTGLRRGGSMSEVFSTFVL